MRIPQKTCRTPRMVPGVDEAFLTNIADAPAVSHPRRATVLELEPEDIAIVDGEERASAGSGPCAVLMIGSWRGDAAHYAIAALRRVVTTPTDEPAEATRTGGRSPGRRCPTRGRWTAQPDGSGAPPKPISLPSGSR